MITEIKGYVKASRKAFTKVTALIVALAIMCAVTAFAASPSFYVDIYDGNEITRVLTSKSDPKTIVSQAGVKLDDRDKLDSTGFTAGEDSALRIYRSATVSFTDIEGNTIYTVFAGTVQDLLEELDVTLSDGQLITYPLDTVLKDGMDVRVTNSYDVSVTADGTTNSFTMGEGTVRDALNRIGVTLGDDDEVSPELDSEASSKAIYEAYTRWCDDNAQKPMSANRVSSELAQNERLYNVEATNNVHVGGKRVRGFMGIEVVNPPPY